MPIDLASLRSDYIAESLSRQTLNHNPVQQLQQWLEQAIQAQSPMPNAMALASVAPDGQPSIRTVLLKGINEHGELQFFTHYESRKGKELAANPKAAVTFYWPELHRQVHARGHVHKLSRQESEAYFHSRPHDSQVSALASSQSQPVDKNSLQRRVEELSQQFANKLVPCPEHWGGYALRVTEWEFWQGRPSRLHDRFAYTRDKGSWKIQRLAP